MSNLKESAEALEWQDCLDKYLWVCFPFPQTAPLLSTVSRGEIDPVWYVMGLCFSGRNKGKSLWRVTVLGLSIPGGWKAPLA